MTDERPGQNEDMSAGALNVLAEPLIRVEMQDGVRTALTLPEVCAALAEDRVGTFPALRGHQTHAWHAFLVQLAAMGLEALGAAEPPGDDPSDWTAVFRALTTAWPGDEPWCLVSPPTVPALLQAPVPESESSLYETRFKKLVLAPDALDMLATAKNHDLKSARMRNACPDDWLFALVSLQTQEGVMGRGNYGVARMNSGYGNRTYVSLRPAGATAGALFGHELAVLQAAHNDLHDAAAAIGLATEEAAALLWTVPWDGADSLPLSRLHPLFVEICRRVRLERHEGELRARVGNSQVARVAAKHLAGNLADPWTPVERSDEAKAFSVTREGFSYWRMSELLFGSSSRSWRLPVLARPQGQGDMQLVAAGIARGQGKTSGIHQRAVDMPAHVISLLETDADAISARAHERIQTTATVQRKCLRPALVVLVQKGTSEPSWDKPSNQSLTRPWLDRFEKDVDDIFFAELWDSLGREGDEAAGAWERTLAGVARRTLEAACEAAPRTDDRRIMARARAGNLLENALRKHLTSLTPTPEEQRDVA